ILEEQTSQTKKKNEELTNQIKSVLEKSSIQDKNIKSLSDAYNNILTIFALPVIPPESEKINSSFSHLKPKLVELQTEKVKVNIIAKSSTLLQEMITINSNLEKLKEYKNIE